MRIFGEEHQVRAEVERIDGYSAHADRDELLTWVEGFDRQRLQQVFLVHGEEEAAFVLAEEVRKRGVFSVQVPERGEEAELKWG